MQELKFISPVSVLELERDEITLEVADRAAASAKLERRYVHKPWGRTSLPAPFACAGNERIGEIWFPSSSDMPILPKYLFSGEALSVQVHPDDDQARRRGLPRGKAECWYILDAAPGAAVGLGLSRELSPQELRCAAADGSIEQLIDWREVRAGDFFFVPPGTIHAIGAGISLLEIQQNSDTTYRLYDYGRPRDLHLDEAVEVARAGPYPEKLAQRVNPDLDSILVDGSCFTLLHTRGDALLDHRRWILPIEGKASFGGEIAQAGDCLVLEPQQRLDWVDGRLFVAAAAAPARHSAVLAAA